MSGTLASGEQIVQKGLILPTNGFDQHFANLFVLIAAAAAAGGRMGFRLSIALVRTTSDATVY